MDLGVVGSSPISHPARPLSSSGSLYIGAERGLRSERSAHTAQVPPMTAKRWSFRLSPPGASIAPAGSGPAASVERRRRRSSPPGRRPRQLILHAALLREPAGRQRHWYGKHEFPRSLGAAGRTGGPSRRSGARSRSPRFPGLRLVSWTQGQFLIALYGSAPAFGSALYSGQSDFSMMSTKFSRR